MKRILVCLDHSDRATFVFAKAKDLAERYPARIVLLHVVVPSDGLTLPGAPLAPELERRVEDARRELQEAASQLPAERVHAVVVEVGEPWRVICTAARAHSVELVVVGSHGPKGIEKLLGTTATKVAEHADRTVVILRPTPRE